MKDKGDIVAGSLLRRVAGIAALAIGLSIAVAAPANAAAAHTHHTTTSSHVMRPLDWWLGP